MSAPFSRAILDILDAADTGRYGSCVFAARSDEVLATGLAAKGMLVRLHNGTFRTTPKGQRALARDREPAYQ